MLDLNLVLQLNEDIVLRGVSDKYWALNVKNGNQYKLNDVAYFLLSCFREPKSVKLSLEEIMREYRVEYERILKDSESVLQIAIDNNIVKEVKL